MSESPDQFEEEDRASEAHLAQEVTALERLQLCGGSFDIRSQPGAGTRATLFLPYQSAPDSAGER